MKYAAAFALAVLVPSAALGADEDQPTARMFMADYADRLCTIEMTVGYVPSVMLLSREAEPDVVFTAVVWGDAMPIALPRTDYVLLAGKTSPDDVSLVRTVDIEALLGAYPKRDGHFPHVMVDHDTPPETLLQALLALGGPPEPLVRHSIDQVLDRELVESSG